MKLSLKEVENKQMKNLNIILNLLDLKVKNKLGQDSFGARGKDGQLLVAPFSEGANSASLRFSLLSPDGLPGPSYHARKKFFVNDEDSEIIEEEPGCPGYIPRDFEDLCIHDRPLGECGVCEEEEIIEGEPTEIEED